MPKYRPPMPLTAFEEYMFRDDRPSHPMSIVFRLRFSGALDRDAASVAWSQTIGRHVLLRSTILAVGNRRPCWISAETLPPLCWTSELARGMPEMEPIDLVTEPGLRGWAASDGRQSAITLQAHHAACDGKAVVQVADDFLRSYARAMDGRRCSVGAVAVRRRHAGPAGHVRLDGGKAAQDVAGAAQRPGRRSKISYARTSSVTVKQGTHSSSSAIRAVFRILPHGPRRR